MPPNIAAKWIALGAMAAAGAALMIALGMSVDPVGLIPVTAFVAALFGIGVFYEHSGRSRELADFAHCGALQVAFSVVAAILSYSTTALNLPLTDAWLDAADRALGFDWVALFDWMKAHPDVDLAMKVIYFTLIPQAVICLVVLGLTGRCRENNELIWSTILSGAATVVISGAWPAVSAMVYYDVLDRAEAFHWAHYAALRAGTMREIDLFDIKGLTTFPSFHTTLAILVTHAVRKIPVLFAIYVPLNAALIFSVMHVAGHYLIDVPGGIVIAIAAIATARRLEDRWAYRPRAMAAYA